MSGEIAFESWYAQQRSEFNAAFEAHARAIAARECHSRTLRAVEYSLIQPGKRLRPVLVLEACRLAGGRTTDGISAAMAIECVHTFSLIHDDLPAMDDDDLRRGIPTNHKVFGEAIAVLAGDWLSAHAFELLADCGPHAGRLCAALAVGTQAMVEGQGADIEGESQPPSADRVDYIHQHKTAALIETALRLGAICGGASATAESALATYGRCLGLAFQIQDDVLDATQTTALLGKRAGKDAESAKQTYPAVVGLERSRRRAQEEVDRAIRAVEFLPGNRRLVELARFVISRAS